MRLPQRGIVVLAGTVLTGLIGTRIVVEPVSTRIVVDLKLENPGGKLQIQQPLQAKPQQLLQLLTIHRTTRRRLIGRPSFSRNLDGDPALVGRKGMMNQRSSTEQRSIRPWQDFHRSHMILPPIELSFSRHPHLDLLHCIFLPVSIMKSL